jgi:hypothetical protein
LGEAIMIKNQASGRQDRLARSVERTAKQFFNLWTQMARVHYTEKHWFTYNGGDGDFDHVVLTRHMIDEGMQVNVRAGTTLPFDKARQEATAMNLAKMELISPLDVYKDLHMDNPQQRYDNWVKFKTDPMSLAQEVENQTQDGQAYMEFVEILNGVKNVKPFEDASVEHILTHRKQMITDKFLKADRKIQLQLLNLIEAELRMFELKQQIDMSTQPPGAPQGAPAAPGQPPAAPMGAPGMMQPTPPAAPVPGAPMGAPPMPAPAAAPPPGAPLPGAAPNLNLANPASLPLV